MKKVNFNTLGKWGLIYKINKEILHPLGLALSYYPDSGCSDGAFVDDIDFKFLFEEAVEEEAKKLLAEFEKNPTVAIIKELEGK